ncbi:endonuclease/exonuclease/phosphatase family protein [Candidatus Uabimicrobium sp. HlEnr_7]|uniref:endonuclease/exonuclease/phosphatase family protein n=1 Tax=Candidatus Uabimicrobium helgolandensis TaxID=3095367 RepID=UPI0035578272
MKAEIVLWSLAIFMGFYSYTSSQITEKHYRFSKMNKQDLRVITWNVGGSSGEKGNALRYEFIPRIVNTIKSLQPDIIFLQELVGRHQAESISYQLRGWRFIVAKGSNRQTAIFFKNGFIRNAQSIPAEPRHFVICDYYHKKRVVSLLGLHASAYSAKRRNTVIGYATDTLRQKKTKYKILAGDLNVDIGLDKRHDLFSDNEQLDVETYNYAAKFFKDTTLLTGNTAEPDRRLDYIFASGFVVKRGGPILNVKTGDMDHHPVVVDLNFE